MKALSTNNFFSRSPSPPSVEQECLERRPDCLNLSNLPGIWEGGLPQAAAAAGR